MGKGDICQCHTVIATPWPFARGNPKLKALNPKQIPISKFKVQNAFGHLILFSISDLVFRILFSGIASPRLIVNI